MELMNPLAEAYAEQFTSAETELLAAINKQTLENHPHAHMLSGHVQGKFLSLLSTLLQPNYILEIGSFTGYSAICLAAGLSNTGELHTIECREEDAATAKSNFSKSERNKQIHLHIGNALSIIPDLHYAWDLVFIDADKTSYIDYYEMVMPRLNEGGLIVADNVFFHGDVLKEPITGKNGKAIHRFNEHVKNDPRSEQVMVTLRDGLLLIKKKK
jgi:caffeoyl-CoA O-methyltransferase